MLVLFAQVNLENRRHSLTLVGLEEEHRRTLFVLTFLWEV